MSENQNRQSFIEKMKNTKVNRASVITAVVLVVAIAVIVSVTIATNRSKDVEEPPKDTGISDVTDNTPETEPPETDAPETDAPVTNKPTGENNSTQVENKLPSFILPTNGVLSAKHDPEVQVYSNTLNHYRVHLGIDIATDESAPVYAAADGTVSKIWKDELMGYSIAIKHSGDSYTFYRNLDEELPTGIKEGATVRSGQLIANVGDSAMAEVAEEPHLHFEMMVADLAVDPLAYFDESALKSLKLDASYE